MKKDRLFGGLFCSLFCNGFAFNEKFDIAEVSDTMK